MSWDSPVIISKQTLADNTIRCTVDLTKRINFVVPEGTADPDIQAKALAFADILNDFEGLTADNMKEILASLQAQTADLTTMITNSGTAAGLMTNGNQVLVAQKALMLSQQSRVDSLITFIQGKL